MAKGLVQSGRTKDVVTYQGGNDVFSFELSAEADGTDSTSGDGETGISGVQAGASIGLGDNWTIAAAFRNAEDSANSPTDEDVVGATVYGSIGSIGLAGSFQADENVDGYTLLLTVGGFFVEYGGLEVDAASARGDAGTDPVSLAAGYSASIGENTSWWIEAVNRDSDDLVVGGEDQDSTEIVAALRFDF